MLQLNSATFTLNIGLQQESLGLRFFLDGKIFYHFGIVTHKTNLQRVRSCRDIFESELPIEICKNLLVYLN